MLCTISRQHHNFLRLAKTNFIPSSRGLMFEMAETSLSADLYVVFFRLTTRLCYVKSKTELASTHKKSLQAVKRR